MAKRKRTNELLNGSSSKKRAGSKFNPANQSSTDGTEIVKASFTQELFEDPVKHKYRDSYASSEPYKHAVIQPLIDDTLLRNVRYEILANLHFTRKETDIYRIHQSGDLANLSGLSASALKLLPSLLKLRNAMYSRQFREYISFITNCGPLSGKKTDMAINVYTKGCHLLCHDDVIGSRRVSYILYLTDPDDPWKPKWGGALRLYPTSLMDDNKSKVPSAEWCKVIPPAWNQLSLFAVQPGESFHDVEEVFEEEKIRMAISGWFHIPQPGEEGYNEGEEERLAERSSLQQLQSKADTYDLPQPNVSYYDDQPTSQVASEQDDETVLTAADCEFLLKYISPIYLTPDTLDDIKDELAMNSSIQLANFLSKSYATKVNAYVEARDGSHEESKEQQEKEGWKVAVPPHKQRFLYLQDVNTTVPEINRTEKGKTPAASELIDENPIKELLTKCFPSKSFKKLIQIATGLKLSSHDMLARRFRRGLDYTLATGWEPDPSNPKEGEMKVELCLGLTPSKGWDGEEDQDVEEEATAGKQDGDSSAVDSSKAPAKNKPEVTVRETPFSNEGAGVGGYEMYMAGDDDEEDLNDGEETKDQKFGGKKMKPDPAIYKLAADGEDDAAVFSMGAAWNRLSIVLRDGGLLKFVKYISRSAQGDRWDIVGSWGTVDEDGGSDEEDQDSEDQDSEDQDSEDQDSEDQDSEDQDKNNKNEEEETEEEEESDDGDDGEEWNGFQD
ncbi:Oxoglutarate and iron-dependent oxygenase degradation C-term-domain-containing protein [Kalaharituber pfeilii]|nr:Oxoglutarate and iron-dependent oxygenase degradation C-term-domain-containing protein [Kalaharituber pfeilii]